MANFGELVNDVMAFAPTNDRSLARRQVNAAARQISQRIPLKQTVVSKTFATSKARYSLATDFTITDIGRLLAINRTDNIRNPTIEHLDMEEIIARQVSGSIGLITGYGRSGDTIAFSPLPAEDDIIVFTYVPYITDLTSDSADYDDYIMSEFSDAIAVLAASKIAPRESVTKARELRAWYNDLVTDYWKAWMGQGGGMMTRLIVGYPTGGKMPFHDPSTYVSGQ